MTIIDHSSPDALLAFLGGGPRQWTSCWDPREFRLLDANGLDGRMPWQIVGMPWWLHDGWVGGDGILHLSMDHGSPARFINGYGVESSYRLIDGTLHDTDRAWRGRVVLDGILSPGRAEGSDPAP